jgi:hypothetical protein
LALALHVQQMIALLTCCARCGFSSAYMYAAGTSNNDVGEETNANSTLSRTFKGYGSITYIIHNKQIFNRHPRISTLTACLTSRTNSSHGPLNTKNPGYHQVHLVSEISIQKQAHWRQV